ncbi:MAG TPA: hemolysin III family protein, partial [Anaerolinea sp.]|nr:hemolysin III family protein [Anaerolinea sp.]
LALREMLAALSTGTILWLFAGGVIYTFGALVYVTKKMEIIPGVFGFHEVWHIFVTLGAAAHFIAVMTLIAA